MKKYLIAATVALTIFAIAAFAASLNVDGGVLQAGTDNDLVAAGEATVTWGTQTSGDGQFHVNKMTVDFDDASADGNYAYVAVFHSPANQVGFAIAPVVAQQVVLNVNPAVANSLVQSITQVSVMLKTTSDAGVSPADTFFSGIITGTP